MKKSIFLVMLLAGIICFSCNKNERIEKETTREKVDLFLNQIDDIKILSFTSVEDMEPGEQPTGAGHGPS